MQRHQNGTHKIIFQIVHDIKGVIHKQNQL